MQTIIPNIISTTVVRKSLIKYLLAAARHQAAADKLRLNTSIEAFEPPFFNNMCWLWTAYLLNGAGFTAFPQLSLKKLNANIYNFRQIQPHSYASRLAAVYHSVH